MDGLVTKIVRDTSLTDISSQKKQWIVFDGQVDSLWVENMNSVLDDNRMMCLPSQ